MSDAAAFAPPRPAGYASAKEEERKTETNKQEGGVFRHDRRGGTRRGEPANQNGPSAAKALRESCEGEEEKKYS